jgi:predicted dehydrogenase
MGKIIKTGIIGFGLSGKAFHAPFLNLHPGFEVKKVFERNKAESKEIYPNVEVVRTFKEMIDDPEIELLVHCTPNPLHFPLVKESLEAGKHVVVEKPFTNSLKEADELIRLAEKKNLKIFVYHNRRWDADFLTIQKLLKRKLLGDISYYESHFDRFKPEISDNWRDKEIPGSGVLYDLGPHLIDQVLILFGKPQSLRADIQIQRPNSCVDDYFKIQFQFKDKEVVVTAGAMVREIGPRFIVKGSKGEFVKYGLDPQEALLRQGKMPLGEDWGQEPAENYGEICCKLKGMDFNGRIKSLPGDYRGFYKNVYDVLTKDADIKINIIEARLVILLIELARKSSNENRVIKID